MPTVEGLQFAYALYPLPPGRLPFRRWRWELWHGADAGRRRLADLPPAGRARAAPHAAEFGHRLFGLPAPERAAAAPAAATSARARRSGSRSARSRALARCRAALGRRPRRLPRTRSW